MALVATIAVGCGSRSNIDTGPTGVHASRGASGSGTSTSSGGVGGSPGGISSSGLGSSGGFSSSGFGSSGGFSSSGFGSSGGRIDGGSSGSVQCGLTTCDAATAQCCAQIGLGGAFTGTCSPKSAPCPGLVTLACTSSTNCPSGDQCCLSVVLGGPAGLGAMATCETACGQGGPNGSLLLQLCATDAECSSGKTCRGGTNLLGVRACN